ncbi:MAG TPA: 5-formyltetrahydrofolate cyclo-ligase [Candidatus Latescibacteria bacterium]|nr:5-formyltetrahydrofolate cyclo-ligase [Candidatus Latescibacterota bacterium]
MTKAQLRRQILRLRKALPPNEVRRLSAAVLSHLYASELYRNSHVVHTYVSVDNEVDTWPLIVRALKEGKQVVVPVVSGKGRLRHSVIDYISELVRGKWGLWEPRCFRDTDLAAVDLVLVPGVVFDRRGYRVGFGGGYYDRFLSQVSAPKVGLAFGFQVVSRIPEDPHDERVGYLATEDGIFEIN